MSERIKIRSRNQLSNARAREIALALVIVLCGASSIPLVRFQETRRAGQVSAAARDVGNEELYANADFVRSVVPSAFRGFVADYYWMRALQYVGRKTMAHEGDIQLDDLGTLNLRLLAPLLDTATTLDPQFLPVYEYGAVVLPAIDDEVAIRLARKGIESNPQAWRLYYQLGYIYWQQERFAEASTTYQAGSQIAGAPAWMSSMVARMEAEGGSRTLAREMFRRMLEESDDERIKLNAAKRLLWLQSLDERDAVRRLLTDYRAQTNSCPARWSEVARELRRMNLRVDVNGAPLDPAGTAYILTNGGCDVDLDRASEVPYR